MLTPAFELSQEADFLLLSIRVPYTRTSEFDLYIDGEDFKFYAKPYFLRLTLPGRIVEDGREKASFDVDKGLFSLRVPKETPGQHFEGLQMLTSLLAPKGSRSARPLVEDMDACSGTVDGEEEEEEEEEEFDWQVDQQVYKENSEEETNALQKYGFGNLRSGVFARLQDELSDVVDVKTPDCTTATERREERLAAEIAKFDPDHYLADLFEDDAVQSLLKFRPWWRESSQDPGVTFSEEEKDQLRKFTNRSYLLDRKSRLHAWLGLLDVVLAYAYDGRTTEGEHNVESSWNIRKLSGTLCWLETYSSVQEVLVSFGRRVLCYPLHRHFGLVTAAIKDAALILRSGKACVLKCLLDVHKIFRENDPAYILNDLYITDYCVWIQRVKAEKLTALAEPLRKTSLLKSDLGLQLPELERAAELVVEEEQQDRSRDGGAQRSRSREDSTTSSSSSSDSEESQDSSAEGRGGGEPAAGGPLGPAPVPSCPPAPRARPPGHTAPSPLVQELGERVQAELRISALPQGAASWSGRVREGEGERGEGDGERVQAELRISGLPEGAGSRSRGERGEGEGEGEREREREREVERGEREREREREVERGEREGDGERGEGDGAVTSHTTAVQGDSHTAPSRTVLEVRPRRNPLLIVPTGDEDDDDDGGLE